MSLRNCGCSSSPETQRWHGVQRCSRADLSGAGKEEEDKTYRYVGELGLCGLRSLMEKLQQPSSVE